MILDYSLELCDHIWLLDYKRSAIFKSSLDNSAVLDLIARYMPDDFVIKRSEEGKPFAYSAQHFCPYFSLSHSSKILIIAFSLNPIGVDIELIKKRSFIKRITQRYFSTDPQENLIDFYRSWTAREAYIKAANLSLRQLSKITINTKEKLWRIGTNYNFYIKFKYYNKYLIALCREYRHKKGVSYFNARLL